MSHNAYLRRLRARWSLSQEDLAELLGITQGRISHYEKGEEGLSLPVLFGLQVIFGRSPRSFLNQLYGAVEDAVIRRAAEFERGLSGKTDYASTKKRQLLEAMMARATKQDQT